MTHTFESNNKKYLIVQVRKDAKIDYLRPIVLGFPSLQELVYPYHVQAIELPAGNYTYLFVAEEATEEQAEEVVEYMSRDTGGDDYYTYYRNYLDNSDFPWFKEVPNGSLKSLDSLIRATFPDHANFKHVVLLQQP